MKQKPEIKLGCKCRDTISGFTGICIAITTWLNGCVRITIAPQELKDGKPVESHTFDVQQVEVVVEAPVAKSPSTRPPGGPSIAPTRNSDPK